MSSLIIYLGIGLVLFGFAHTDDFSCDEILSRKKILLEKNPNCGNAECLCEGSTAICLGNRTTTNVPQLPSDIDTLYIECYGLSDLTRKSFANIEKLNLTSLYLRQNSIYSISKDIFSAFSYLTVLEISDNERINNSLLFIALGSLQKTLPFNLTLNNTGIRNITDNIFEHMNITNVKHLSLANNKIELLNLTALHHLTSLRSLQLNNNLINDTTNETTGIEQMKSLEMLDLSDNHLNEHARFCMKNGSSYVSFFPKLQTLRLVNNQIGTFDGRSKHKWACLKSVKWLNLSENKMQKLNISYISIFESLEELRLESNWIKDVIPGIFPENLTTIDFRNNEITAFPPKLCDSNSNLSFPNIKVLNFRRNYIQKIMTSNWVCLPGIRVLDFSKNDVGELKNNTFANHTALEVLHIDNMIPWVKVIEPAAFNSSSLQFLDIRFNWIDFSKPAAQQLFRYCPNVTWIDISYNFFMGVPESTITEMLSPMKNLEVLKAQRISLKMFPSSFLLTFRRLRYLDINRNLLDVIQFPDTFNNRSLNLSIRYISAAEGDINTIDQLAFPTSIMDALEGLDVSNNEFACTCKLLWFRDQIQNRTIGNIEILNWPEGFECRSPTKLVGKLLKDYTPEEVCEPIKPLFIALISVGCSLFVFTVLFATGYWNRWYLQYYWYKISRRRSSAKSRNSEAVPLLDKIEYDGYVVYNEGDEDFVHHPFRNLMENNLRYKLHIWKRNAKHGALVDVILDAMYASKHVLVIVSDKLIKDTWCKFQVDVALDRSIDQGKNCVMLVVLGNTNFKALSKEWCVLLTKTPTADWSDSEDENDIARKLFEQKIRKYFGNPLCE